jgi:hypothetical protein
VSFLFLAWLVFAYLVLSSLNVGNFQYAFITFLITLFPLLVKALVPDITEHSLVDQSQAFETFSISLALGSSRRVGYVSVCPLLWTSPVSEVHNAMVPAFLSFQQGRPCFPHLLDTVAARVAFSNIPRALASGGIVAD